MTSENRADPTYARQIIEKLLPDPTVRLPVLSLLVELIQSANRSPDKWGITLFPNQFALNTGRRYYTFWLEKSVLHLYWIAESNEEEPPGTRASFTTLVNARTVDKKIAEELIPWLEILRPRIERLITAGNASTNAPLHPKAQRSHSPGILRYLEEELGISLPDPIYPPPAATFTWIPFFEELAERVLTYRNRQEELIGLLQKLHGQGRKVTTLDDRDASGSSFPLTVQDPFTFFSHFCRGITFANKKDIFSDLKAEWGLESPVPTDLRGVPEVNNQRAWFFSYESHRAPTDLDALWDIAEQAIQGAEAITESAWRNALEVRQVGLAKLTMGFFWLNPEEFLPLDQNVRGYLRRAGVTVPDPITLSQYRTLLAEAQDRLQMSLPEISYAAFQNTPLPTQIKENASDTYMPLPIFPLNTILYGPPGTGKTYETARRAVMIIDDSAPDDRKELMARYRQLQREGRIGFVTFHQSYAYEDFIEGIRPVMDEEDGEGSPRYRIVDGVFKELALNALGTMLHPTLTTSNASPSFAVFWEALVEKIENEPAWTLKGRGHSEYQLSLTTLGNLQGVNVKGNAQRPYSATRSKIEQVWHQLPEDQEPSHNALMDILKVGTHTNLIGAVIDELRSIAKTPPKHISPPEKSAKEKARAYLRNSEASALTLEEVALPRYVLIVDEINRGNISKILGELITLLEDDKRIGEDNELTVTLPYSRETFGVPSNLYLVGTMNTADKSLALLDVALRRRFTFEELTPDFSVCGLSPEMQKALEELNRRITLRKDRDHRIGHAFFMKVGSDTNAFDAAFRGKVLPLLQEYFFNDWDGVRYVLGELDKPGGFVMTLGSEQDKQDKNIRNRWQWYTDAGIELSPLTQLVKNYGYNQTS
ncbi:McrB family protein [Armatimonas sp.]|uniref:McrB family protein n=1 Tax=Armatimonas sp. TaxID=1872638 RepID=UPI003753A100